MTDLETTIATERRKGAEALERGDWHRYEQLKRDWDRRHPEASAEERQRAIMDIARRLGL